MKKLPFKGFAYALACAAVVTACGGGTDDEAGAPAPLNIIPDALVVTNVSGVSCPRATSEVTRVFINGGTAPYRVDSTSPEGASFGVTTNVVAHRGESFGVLLGSGCVTTMPIIVRDSMNVIVTFSLTHKYEAPASGP